MSRKTSRHFPPFAVITRTLSLSSCLLSCFMVLESGVRGVMATRGTLQPRSLGDIGERETAAQVREMLFFYYYDQPLEIFDSIKSERQDIRRLILCSTRGSVVCLLKERKGITDLSCMKTVSFHFSCLSPVAP